MRDNKTVTLSFLVLGLAVGTASAQVQQDMPESNLISKSVKAVGYRVGGGSTKVDLKGTELMSLASGEAKVDARQGKTNIEVAVKNLEPPSKFGAEFLTYVLWVVTPDGRSGNTGEILIDKDGEGKLGATTPAQTFSMIVTAEPYFAVRVPSEVVILENDTRKSTKGQIFPINDFKLMKRAQYEKLGNPLAMTPDLERVPLQMYEARNAVDIAKSRSADKDAPEIFTKAASSLQMAENALSAKAERKTSCLMPGKPYNSRRTHARSRHNVRTRHVSRQRKRRLPPKPRRRLKQRLKRRLGAKLNWPQRSKPR